MKKNAVKNQEIPVSACRNPFLANISYTKAAVNWNMPEILRNIRSEYQMLDVNSEYEH